MQSPTQNVHRNEQAGDGVLLLLRVGLAEGLMVVAPVVRATEQDESELRESGFDGLQQADVVGKHEDGC